MSGNQSSRGVPDRLSVPPKPGGNKSVVFLLLGGLVILGIAVAVYVTRKSEPPPEPEKVVEPTYEAPRPLVAAPSRPIVDREPDAGTEVKVAALAEEDPKKTPRGGYQEKLGTIDVAAVNAFMNQRFAQVRLCYERRLKMNPFLEGDLDLNISISSAGKVTGIAVTADSLRDGEMLDCVRRTIRGWAFPKPEGGRAVVAKNFKFKKKS